MKDEIEKQIIQKDPKEKTKIKRIRIKLKKKQKQMRGWITLDWIKIKIKFTK